MSVGMKKFDKSTKLFYSSNTCINLLMFSKKYFKYSLLENLFKNYQFFGHKALVLQCIISATYGIDIHNMYIDHKF